MHTYKTFAEEEEEEDDDEEEQLPKAMSHVESAIA